MNLFVQLNNLLQVVKEHFLFLTFIFFLSSCANKHYDDPFLNLIQSADSVVIISHVLTAEYGPKIVKDENSSDTSVVVKKEIRKNFLVSGKVNKEIIERSAKLTDVEVKQLIQLFAAEYLQDEEINQMKCDLPHNTIIIFSRESQSYIDMCIPCKTFHTSADIKESDLEMSTDKWSALESFLKQHGIKVYACDEGD